MGNIDQERVGSAQIGKKEDLKRSEYCSNELRLNY